MALKPPNTHFGLLCVGVAIELFSSGVVTRTNSLLVGLGSGAAGVTLGLRNFERTRAFMVPFLGTLAIGVASLLDAFNAVVGSDGWTWILACGDIAAVTAGNLISSRSVWVWREAPWQKSEAGDARRRLGGTLA